LAWDEYIARYSTIWAESDLRAYLNGEFMSRFSESDRARIAETLNENKDNQWWGAEGGADTSDRIFLLSLEEVVRYFGDSGQLGNRPSENTWYIDDKYNEARVAYAATDLTYTYAYGGGTTYTYEAGTASWWWRLRSPGFDGYGAAGVRDDGNINVGGGYVSDGNGGVRPALWLNL
jgi:hypothetical protein